jgi:peroxiredoxin
MKRSIYLVFVVLIMASCSSKPHYTVKGRIDGSDSIKFYLQKRDSGKPVTIDSAISKKGSFIMKRGSIDYPQLVMLTAGSTRKRIPFYLENSEITITGNLDSLYKARVTGSKTQDEYNSLLLANKSLSEKYSKTFQEYQVSVKSANPERLAQLTKQADSIQKEMIKLQKDFVRNNPASYVTPAILSSLSYDMEPEELESFINNLDSAVTAVPLVATIKERLEAMKTVAVGKKAPLFTMSDVNGNPVSLSSKIGTKLLLLDFWAAWCRPCREENPNLVKVYKEYHNKGFDVISVSLDRSREDWLKAIKADKLAWTQVSDMKYKGNAAAQLYLVNSIPANFLLDDTGTIIGKNLIGDDLYKKVKEVLEK